MRDAPAFRFYRGLTTKDVWIYSRSKSLGRAFFVDNVLVVSQPEALRSAMKTRDLTRTAVVAAPQALLFGNRSSKRREGDRIQTVVSQPGKLVVETKISHPRYVVVSEVWHPGWSATLDGKPVPLFRTDLALMGTFLPAGTHTLRLVFSPIGLQMGIVISAVAGMTWLLLLLFYLSRRRRGRFERT